jgi:murein DD-endopeptidase MepM/ murein hydrolase activator NlpD
MSTGYNHAISYTVHVGEHVRAGEIIGYSRHHRFLHRLPSALDGLALDGRVVNPMTWF